LLNEAGQVEPPVSMRISNCHTMVQHFLSKIVRLEKHLNTFET